MYFQQTVTMNECQQHLCPWGEFLFLSGKTRQSGLDIYLIPSKSSVWRRHFCRSVVLPAFVHGFISSVAVHLLNFLKTFYVFLGCLFFSPLYDNVTPVVYNHHSRPTHKHQGRGCEEILLLVIFAAHFKFEKMKNDWKNIEYGTKLVLKSISMDCLHTRMATYVHRRQSAPNECIMWPTFLHVETALLCEVTVHSHFNGWSRGQPQLPQGSVA